MCFLSGKKNIQFKGILFFYYMSLYFQSQGDNYLDKANEQKKITSKLRQGQSHSLPPQKSHPK